METKARLTNLELQVHASGLREPPELTITILGNATEILKWMCDNHKALETTGLKTRIEDGKFVIYPEEKER